MQTASSSPSHPAALLQSASENKSGSSRAGPPPKARHNCVARAPRPPSFHNTAQSPERSTDYPAPSAQSPPHRTPSPPPSHTHLHTSHHPHSPSPPSPPH